MQTTLDGSPRLVVVHTDAADPALREAATALHGLSETGHVSSFFFVYSDSTRGPDLSVDAEQLDSGETQPVDLFEEIAKAGALSTIDVVSACTAQLSADVQGHLADSARALAQVLVRLAPARVPIGDHRVFLPEFGDVHPAGRFFDGQATSNLIVVPEDREFDGAFAYPISNADSRVLGWHAAVEIASAAGLWTSMEGSPIEELSHMAAGIDDVIVRVVRSTVRTAVSVQPSVGELMVSNEVLPVPPNFQAAPDPFHAASITSGMCHREIFQLPPLEQFNPRQEVAGRLLLREIGKRIVVDIIQLPATLKSGLANEMDRVAAEIAQTLIGEDSWVRSVWSGDSGSGSRPPPLNVESSLTEIENSEPPLSLVDKVDDEDWDNVVKSVLGVIDGSDFATAVREATGSRQFVAVDRPALAPAADGDLSSSIQALTGGEETPVKTVPSPSGQANEDELETEQPVADQPPGPVLIPDQEKPQPLTLLGMVTRRFKDEEIKANSRVRSLLSRLRELTTPESKERDGATRAVQACIGVSIILLVLAVTTLTSLNEWLTFDGFNADNRMRLFVLASVLMAIPVGLFFVPGDRKRAQVYLISLTTGLTTLLAVLLVFTEDIRKPITDHSTLRWLFSVAVIGCLLVSAITGIWRTRNTTKQWRRVVRTVVKWVSPPYAIAMVIIGINRAEYRSAWVDENEMSLLFTVLVVVIVVCATGVVIVSVVRIQDQFRLNAWSSEFRWLVEETKEAVRDRQIVSGWYVHWLGTAVVLHRLILMPFGERPRTASISAERPAGSEVVRKMRVNALNLTETGRAAFLNSARPRLADPGWLTAQYRSISTAFLDQETFAFGAAEGGGKARPEYCAYPVQFDDALNEKARGMRWPFAYEVYTGKFDATLREAAETELAEVLLNTFLTEPDSWTVEEEAAAAEGLESVFLEILPPESVELPVGALGPTVAAQIPNTDMTPYVWWPDNVPVPDTSFTPTAISRPQGVGSTVLFQAVRVDVSEPLQLSQLGGGDRCSSGGGNFPEGDDDPAEGESRPIL